MSSGNDTPTSTNLMWSPAPSLPRHRSICRLRFKTLVVSVILIAACIATTAFAFIHAGDYLVINEPKSSDLIVVLGGDDGSRFNKAVELLNRGFANKIMIDADASHRWLGRTEVEDKHLQIASMGDIAGHIRVCPITETSTIGETKGFYSCVRNFPISHILIVTSEFHTRRALSTFRRALPQYEWSVASTENVDEFGTAWWKHGEWAATTFGEWEKLLWWKAVDRWLV